MVHRLGLPDRVRSPEVVASERALHAPRILSAAPNVTEICCALGLRAHLVGRTRYCTWPPGIEATPSVGALNDLNVETLLRLDPELILTSGASRAISERLDRLDLRYESVPDVRLDDLYAGIKRIGDLTSRPLTAERLINALRADLQMAAAASATGRRSRVLLTTEPLPDPPRQVSVAGPGSFYDDLLVLGGHTNVVPAGRKPFAPAALEFILAVDPDVIVEVVPDAARRKGGAAEALAAWTRVGPLSAVRTKRVHVVSGPEHFVLGPRIAHTCAALHAALAESPRD